MQPYSRFYKSESGTYPLPEQLIHFSVVIGVHRAEDNIPDTGIKTVIAFKIFVVHVMAYRRVEPFARTAFYEPFRVYFVSQVSVNIYNGAYHKKD